MSDVKNSKMKDWFTLTGSNIKKGASKAWNTTKTGASNLANYAANNPWTTAGLGITGAMNLGGLLDNDKFGGQAFGTLGGAGLGYGLLPHMFNVSMPPQAKILTTLGGGALGSLFDKLRQNKEDQYAAKLNAIQQNTQGVY